MDHPLYSSIRQMLLHHTGVETVFEEVIRKLGTMETVYLTGPLARGTDTSILDVVLIGEVDREYLGRLIVHAEKLTGKKIRIALYTDEEWDPEHLNGIERKSSGVDGAVKFINRTFMFLSLLNYK